MIREKRLAVDAIEAKAGLVTEIADQIWEYAELSLQEEKSADLYCRTLEQEGFRVERGICSIATAFSASYGSGRPVIGILAEYDALSGLSQKAGSLERQELVSGGCGHGCGHNLLGAGAFAAALGVKAYLEETKQPGTTTHCFTGWRSSSTIWRWSLTSTWRPGIRDFMSSGTAAASLIPCPTPPPAACMWRTGFWRRCERVTFPDSSPRQ